MINRLRKCANCACLAVTRNPASARLVGLCPLLAVSNTLLKGATIALLLATIMLFSGAVAALLRNCVSWRLKPIYHALLTSFITAVVIALAQLNCYELIAALGVFPALIASNCLVLSFVQELAERSSFKQTITQCGRDIVALFMFIVVFAALREFAAFGAVFSDRALLVGNDAFAVSSFHGPLPILVSAPGGLLVFALLLAGVNALTRNSNATSSGSSPPQTVLDAAPSSRVGRGAGF